MKAIVAVIFILLLSPMILITAGVVWTLRGPADALETISSFCLGIYLFICEMCDEEK